jgi:hypothetical protein
MPWPRGVPKNMTPSERVERARNAALARTTIDHHINALTGKTLTDEQRHRLTELLRVGTEGAGVDA